jgi:hypothetical protein
MTKESNYIFYDVTDQALELIGVLPLFEVWENDNNKYFTPLDTDFEVLRAVNMGRKVCMTIGTLDNDKVIIRHGITSWMDCKRIIHEGFLYIKFNDLLQCEKSFNNCT